MLKETSKPPLEEHGRAGHGTEEENGEGQPGIDGKQKKKQSQYQKAEVQDPRNVPPEHSVVSPSSLVCCISNEIEDGAAEAIISIEKETCLIIQSR